MRTDVPEHTAVGHALDPTLDRLSAGAVAWQALDAAARAAVLRRCLPCVRASAEEWVEAGCRAKGIDPASSLAGEEWLAGPMTTLRGFRLMADTLAGVDRPDRGTIVRPGPGGRSIVHVFPASLYDRALYLGLTGELWLKEGMPATRALAYRSAGGRPVGGVALVLGAGNVSSIGPLDVLSMLAVHGDVAVLKLNPVNDYLAPVFARAFRPLVDAGYLAIVTGPREVGGYLCEHPTVRRVHLTGSRQTYDAIMWGATAGEQQARRARGEPRLSKPVTAELGCVTPILVVPGEWSAGDLAFQAKQVAATVAHNASFNCVAGKVLVVARDWPQRQTFLDHVAEALASTSPRMAYYPGAHQRYAAFLDRYPAAQVVGASGPDVVPWTILPDVPPRAGEYALTAEAFCGVLAVTTIDGSDAPSFLAHAVPFANDVVEGTLSCMMLVHPATASAHRTALVRAEADLRYGSVAVNVWSGVVFGIGSTTWGAYPGHTPQDIGSGVGVVHNTSLFDHAEKSVVRAPFRMWPKPVWFADHRNLAAVGRRMTAFEAEPSWWQMPGIVAAAVRG
jgi:acyl-CoA reductase-like NAD-dependent aldehyde dehydrogenase